MTTRYHTSLFFRTGFFLCLVGICFTSTACHQLSVGEEKIVGTWEFTGIDATGRVVYRRDHTVVELFPEYDGLNARWVPGSRGTWRLEGNAIVEDKELLPIPGMTPSPRKTTRTPIREFQEERLVRDEDRSDLIRIGASIGVYKAGLALLYVVACLVTFSAAIFGIRNSLFRKECILVAVAAILALVWSTAALVAELAQTGTVIVSAVTQRSLLVPMESVRVASIVILIIGFAKLAYSLRVRGPAKDRI